MPAPMLMNSVIVFGDSLSDIGRKWTTKSGKMARATNQMYVNPSGRFSDCRNWTDYMIEEATGQSLVVSSASGTIALSKMHITLSSESMFSCEHPFQYANYAEGGACGDTPASKGPFLGTFKGQVDWFEQDLRANPTLPLGNTLFFAWFGANDLYTAGRPAEQMHQVADEVAKTQRNRLAQIVGARGGRCRFIFVNLARALTSVRYTRQLAEAEAAVTRALNIGRATPTQARASNLWHAQQALNTAASRNVTSGYFSATGRAVKNLQEKVKLVKGFETGVMSYNAQLAIDAHQNGDHVAEVGNVLSEETISRLFEGNYGLMAGATGERATHVSSSGYSTSSNRPVTTIDEVHPTDQMYKLIWGKIYEEIQAQGTSFGKLSGSRSASTLETLSGPSSDVRGNFGSVLDQIRGGQFQLRPVTRPRR